MLLDSITRPADLRALSYEQLESLAGEIRAFVVQAVNDVGQGHLGSNLGAVELTLALHRVFDSPRDRILWDTGHQAYVHKLVTGRKDDFATLRQAGGLSGYPSRAESEHDWVENSHASTILGYAHGMATGLQVRGEPGQVVAVLGDGSLTGGMAYEGLNNLGHSGRKVVVVLNDNGRSYAPTVSKLGESLTWLRLHPTFVRQRARLERLLQSVPMVGDRLERVAESAEAAVRELWEPPAFFEQLGVRYTGPIDGHDVEALERALTHAVHWDGPIVVHVLTQKGRGHKPALDDLVKNLHDIVRGPDGPVASVLKPDSYTQTFSDSLVKAAEADDRIVAITAAMPDSTGLLPFAERFPDRFLDVGIAEQHAVTAAAGMAMAGLRPVVAIYSTFLTRAFDQVNLDVGLHHQPVVFVIDRAGITGDDGASHHGVLDLALLTKVPGMTVLAPSSAQELEVMFEDALAHDGPVAIRIPKTPARTALPGEVGTGFRARQARAGDGRVAFLTVGKLLAAAEEAADELAADSPGTSATVWDVRAAAPLDPAMIADAAGHDLVVTAEDGLRDGGVGQAIAAAIGDLRGGDAPPVVVLGTPTRYLPHGKADAILADLGLDAAGLVRAVRAALGSHDTPVTPALA